MVRSQGKEPARVKNVDCDHNDRDRETVKDIEESLILDYRTTEAVRELFSVTVFSPVLQVASAWEVLTSTVRYNALPIIN
jgi:hypothetical protein